MLYAASTEAGSSVFNFPSSTSAYGAPFAGLDSRTYDKKPSRYVIRGWDSNFLKNDSSTLVRHSERLVSSHVKDDEELFHLFLSFKKRWEKETRYYSSVDKIVNNDNHKAIVALGKKVLRYILLDLLNNDCLWFVALKRISGVNIIDSTISGDVEKMKSAWLKWGSDQGII